MAIDFDGTSKKETSDKEVLGTLSPVLANKARDTEHLSQCESEPPERGRMKRPDCPLYTALPMLQ